jgi:hypothetical protein
MSATPSTIRLGHANSFIVQLVATDPATRVVDTITEAQMQAIDRIVLHFDDTVRVDSDTVGVGLGSGEGFDHTVDQLNAIVNITIGHLAALATLETGLYRHPHLDVYFTDVLAGAYPVSYDCDPIEVIADDAAPA